MKIQGWSAAGTAWAALFGAILTFVVPYVVQLSATLPPYPVVISGVFAELTPVGVYHASYAPIGGDSTPPTNPSPAAAGGQIVFVNDLFCALSGWKREDIVGLKLDVLIPEKSRRAHHFYRQGYELRPSSRPMDPDREVVLRHKEGHEIRAWVGVDPDDYDNPTSTTSVILPMDIGRSHGLPRSDA